MLLRFFSMPHLLQVLDEVLVQTISWMVETFDVNQMCNWANKIIEIFQEDTSHNNFKTLIRQKIDKLISQDLIN